MEICVSVPAHSAPHAGRIHRPIVIPSSIGLRSGVANDLAVARRFGGHEFRKLVG